jgi:hypothetical protein
MPRVFLSYREDPSRLDDSEVRRSADERVSGDATKDDCPQDPDRHTGC